jgi:hypothetical protein
MLLLAIKGIILDVSTGVDFYHPGKAYHCFVGRDCSRAFSRCSLESSDLHSDLSDATDEERKTLDDWCTKLVAKYPTVGWLVEVPAAAQRRAAVAPRAATPTADGEAANGADDDEWRVVQRSSSPIRRVA